MGVGRRMRKQGPPPSLQELNATLKRKAQVSGQQKLNGNPPKRRRTVEDNEENQRRPKAAAANSKAKRKLLKNNDSQTLPIVNEFLRAVPAGSTSGYEAEREDNIEDDDEDPDEDSQSDVNNGELVSDLENDELDEADLDNISSADSDSVFDSDQDARPKGMFSEDEDESDAQEKLTAANIEGLSRKLDQEQSTVAAEAQEELEDDALQTNIAEADPNLLHPSTLHLAPDLALLRNRITETIRVLSNFAALRDPAKPRSAYTSQLTADISLYYTYTPFLAAKLLSLFPPSEAFAFFEANETPRPLTIRTNTLRTTRRALATALINRGVVLEPVGSWSKTGLQIFNSPVPLGATPEYLAGHYLLQSASSFLPVMALAPQPGERVLDMAAAPGGKTTYISALMRNTGTVFANDASRPRAKALIGNVHRLGCRNVIVCSLDASTAFPKSLSGFDRVLLDAPCSGTGVIAKDPSVKTSKTEADFLRLPHKQKQLLLAAIDSTSPTGVVVYSTCSVTVEENEMVVQYALRKRPNVKIVETGLGTFGSDGFRKWMNKRFDERMKLARRYYPHRENVDGFFVCKLRKTGPTPKSVTGEGVMGSDAAGVEGIDGDDQALRINGDRHRKSPDEHDEDVPLVTGEAADDFGGFDSAEDAKYIANAERKWLRKKGLDPKLASRAKKP